MSFLAYLILFSALGIPWLAAFTHAMPAAARAQHPNDARLVVWILAWVAYALTHDPRRLFDAPIYHPAPLQLTGSEHLLASQIAFAPVYLASRNAVLATNTLAFLSYPLAALALQRLLIALGNPRGPSWIAGLLFALGPLRERGNFQLLQYLNFYLPLTAHSILRLGERPTLSRAAVLTFVITLAAFSSYYLSVMVAVTAVAWAGLELAWGYARRVRFAILAVAAGAVAALALLSFSRPYFSAAESVEPDAPLRWTPLAIGFCAKVFDALDIVLAISGAVLVRSPSVAARRTATSGLALVLLAAFFLFSPHEATPLLRWTVGLPTTLLETYALFFRAWLRFVVLGGFGVALLAGAALSRLHGSRLRVLVPVTAVAVLLVRGPSFWGHGLDELDRHPPEVTATFARMAADHERPSVLELPLRTRQGHDVEGDTMIAATRDFPPLVLGHSGYPPPHRMLIIRLIGELPREEAFDDLVTLTHLGWLVLQPRDRWPRPESRDGLLRLPGLETVLSEEGWDVLRVTRRPRHDTWFKALAKGIRPEHTVLGTPTRPLSTAERQVNLKLANPVSSVRAGRGLNVDLELHNAGAAPWPVVLLPGADPADAVQLLAGWHDGTGLVATLTLPLRRDVEPGETLRQTASFPAPRAPGQYLLELDLTQAHATFLADGGQSPFRLAVEVTR